MKANWFVGLPVTAGPWFDALHAPPARVRLFHPGDLHLTVAFLGAVGEARARAAFEHARAIPLARTAVQLGPVVPMGNRRRPSALSARLLGDGDKAVAQAITAVRDAVCDEAGAPRERRPALPHLTLARPPRSATREELAEAVRWAAALDLGTPVVTLDRVALYTWSADRRARLFDVVAEQPLSIAPA